MTPPTQTAATPEPTAEERHVIEQLEELGLWTGEERAVSAILRSHVAAEVAKATKELREALEAIANGTPHIACMEDWREEYQMAQAHASAVLAARAPRDGGAHAK